MQNSWKVYLRGFAKGVLLLLGLILVIGIILSVNGFDGTTTPVFHRLLLLIMGLLLTSYLVSKYHLPKWWMLIAIFASFYVLPFLMAAAEVKQVASVKRPTKSKKAKKAKK